MRPGSAADHSPPSSAAVVEEKTYASTHPLDHTGPVTGSLYLYYYYYYYYLLQMDFHTVAVVLTLFETK